MSTNQHFAAVCVLLAAGCVNPPERPSQERTDVATHGADAGRASDSGGRPVVDSRPGAESPGSPPGGVPPRDGAAGGDDVGRGQPRLDAAPATGPAPPAGSVPAVVMVGYGGIRALSRDAGKTWIKTADVAPSGGDDNNLLRAIAYGNGTWSTGGFRLFTSPDARTWTEHPQISACHPMEGMAFGHGAFVATCNSDAYTSTDGFSWLKAGSVGNTGGHTYVVFADDQFAASGDNGASFSSPDGKTWQPIPAVTHVASCEGHLHSASDCPGFCKSGCTAQASLDDGAWLSTSWPAKITHSTDGKTWQTVFTDPAGNTGYRFGVGYAPAM